MYDIITIGDVAVDLYFKGTDLPEERDTFQLAIGGKYQVQEVHTGIGGCGANVAFGLSKFGLEAAVCSLVGENSFKQLIMQQLLAYSVSTEFVKFIPDYLNISTILLSSTGERTIIHYPSPEASLEIDGMMLDHMAQATWVYIGHTPNLHHEEKAALITFFRDHDVSVACGLGLHDLQNRESAMALTKKANISFMNLEEYAALINKDSKNIDLEKDLRRELSLDEPLLVITEGREGSHLYGKDGIHHLKAKDVGTIVDSTGAGDAYVAGFLASYTKGGSVEEAMESATEYASQILKRLGTH
ncbi:MAG: 2-dehydro-3-deoxygluconokinase [Microgenomates bacterium OLB22]|nr:MAG: 2-dehydro-3-deoxygluconokinase [Microgenomates bacterium OLB22]